MQETGRKPWAPTVRPMDVHLIRWPAQEERRLELHATHQPRLLMVDDGSIAPHVGDVLEDWIRLPADQNDVRARVAVLRERARSLEERDAPNLGADGVLRCCGLSTVLPPIERRLVEVLLDRFGVVVGRDSLVKAGWPGKAPDRNVLDVHIGRLRKHLAAVNLVLTTVRSRGYMLVLAPTQSVGR